MTKFLVIYERLGFIFSGYAGFEIVNGDTFTKAYETAVANLVALYAFNKGIRRMRVRSIEQVNDDFKPSDAKISTLAWEEEKHRHSEAMAKTKGGDRHE